MQREKSVACSFDAQFHFPLADPRGQRRYRNCACRQTSQHMDCMDCMDSKHQQRTYSHASSPASTSGSRQSTNVEAMIWGRHLPGWSGLCRGGMWLLRKAKNDREDSPEGAYLYSPIGPRWPRDPPITQQRGAGAAGGAGNTPFQLTSLTRV